MAYIDSSAYGGISAGSPSGGGISANAQAAVRAAPGASGYGSSASARSWTFIYLGVIVGILVVTGVIFNGKGRK